MFKFNVVQKFTTPSYFIILEQKKCSSVFTGLQVITIYVPSLEIQFGFDQLWVTVNILKIRLQIAKM